MKVGVGDGVFVDVGVNVRVNIGVGNGVSVMGIIGVYASKAVRSCKRSEVSQALATRL